MMRICLTIMYDGSSYSGWQIQKGLKTVQGEVTLAIKRLMGEDVNLVGSGRTDAGVHALGQTAHFDLEKNFDLKKIPDGLNFYLNKDIRVIKAVKKPADFNARISAKRKTYIYKMYIAQYDNPLLINRELRIFGVDFGLMKAAAAKFVGAYDFKSLMSSGSEVKTTVRHVYGCKLIKKGKSVILTITANGFLYNMVRKITALILSAGLLKREIGEIDFILNPPFNAVKEIVPPFGLYLHSVKY